MAECAYKFNKTIFLLKNISGSVSLYIGCRKGNIYFIATTLSIAKQINHFVEYFYSIFLVLFQEQIFSLKVQASVNRLVVLGFHLMKKRTQKQKKKQQQHINILEFLTNHRSEFTVSLWRQNDAAST